MEHPGEALCDPQWGMGRCSWHTALPPVDAPLRVDPQDSGVFSVVVLHLRVGELGTVDVDNNRGAARGLPGWCQAADLSRVPPGMEIKMGEGMVRQLVTISAAFHGTEHWLPGKSLGVPQVASGVTTLALE